MKKPAIIFLTALLLLAISFIGYSRISQKGQENKILPAEVLLHKSDGSSIVINPSDANYQKIVEKTSRIIDDSILVPVERQAKVTLYLEPATFTKDMDESDYIEIKPDQPLQIPGQREDFNSDRVRFILAGRYEDIILIRSSARPSKYGVGWYSWAAQDEKEFWSLREFLGLPPHPTAGTPALHQETSPLR